MEELNIEGYKRWGIQRYTYSLHENPIETITRRIYVRSSQTLCIEEERVLASACRDNLKN